MESIGREISEGFEDLVRGSGDEVSIHTKVCVEWKLTHENCVDCQSELGCGKTVGMLLASMTPMMYTPTSYEDYEKMSNSIQDKIEKISKAKTVDELKVITH